MRILALVFTIAFGAVSLFAQNNETKEEKIYTPGLAISVLVLTELLFSIILEICLTEIWATLLIPETIGFISDIF